MKIFLSVVVLLGGLFWYSHFAYQVVEKSDIQELQKQLTQEKQISTGYKNALYTFKSKVDELFPDSGEKLGPLFISVQEPIENIQSDKK